MASRRGSWIRRAERDSYLITRALGTVNAAQKGGAPRVAKRLVRRRVRRFISRKSGGWL
jgi:hypothetical protein